MATKDEMLVELAKFFTQVGVLDRVQYRTRLDAPYTFREVKRVFKNYASMLRQVKAIKVVPVKAAGAAKAKAKKVTKPVVEELNEAK